MKRRQLGASPSQLRKSAVDAVDRYRQVLEKRSSRTLLLAAVCSNIGDWLSFVALMSLAVDFGNGAIGVGGLLALRLVPTILFQVFAGTVVDRMTCKRLLVLTQLVMAVLAWSFLLLHEFESLWLLYLLVVLLEVVNAFARPAFMVQLVNSVEPDHRGAVNGLFAMSVTIAQFAGALAGAVVLRATGEAPLFIINGLTFFIIAIAVARLPTQAEESDDEEMAEPAADSMEKGLAGYTQLLRRSDVFAFALVTLAVSIMTQAAISLFEVRSERWTWAKAAAARFSRRLRWDSFLAGLWREPESIAPPERSI